MKKRSWGFRIVIGAIALIGLLVLIAVIGLMWISPKPLSEEEWAAIEALERRIQTMQPTGGRRIDVQQSDIVKETHESTERTPQQIVDQHYIDMLAGFERFGIQNGFYFEQQKVRHELLGLARALAKYYDQGIVVSDEVRRRHQPVYNRGYFNLAWCLLETDATGEESNWHGLSVLERMERFELACKFLKVLGVPVMIDLYAAAPGVSPYRGEGPIQQYMNDILMGSAPVYDTIGENRKLVRRFDPAEYAAALAGFDPTLIAERKFPQWSELMPSVLENALWISSAYYEETAYFGGVRWIHQQNAHDIWDQLETAVYENLNILEIAMDRSRRFSIEQRCIQALVDHSGPVESFDDIEAVFRNALDEDEHWASGGGGRRSAISQCFQALLRQRVQAAALDLFQGNPLPEEITPDSLLFNPFDENPIRVRRSQIRNGETIGWMVTLETDVPSLIYANTWVYLDPNHPALENIPVRNY